MLHSVVIREARAQDKTAILAFCQNTFSWGDYISEVWDAWLADDRGKIFVGAVNDQPVGMLHVAFLNDSAAWMEGMRVHPDHRRLGVSSAMDAAGRAYARERGRKLVRLATSQDNIAAQKMLEREGYICTERYGGWRAQPTRGKMARIATENDLPIISACWRNVPCAIVANPEWRWEKLNDAALAELQRQNFLRAAEDGFAILRKPIDENALILHALAGSENAMRALAHSARTEANYRGFEFAQAMILDEPRINNALERAGFKRDGGMLIYEQAL
jgi:GNAT superfamily N-acetyltransferase